VLEELEDVAVRVEEEDLRIAVSARHRAACEGDTGAVETRAGSAEIVDLEGEVVRQAALGSGSRVALTRSSGRVALGEQVELGASEAKPRAGEDEVRRSWHLLEPERVGVEAPRAIEVGYDEPDVLDPHRHRTYRNLAPSKGGAMPLIRVELFDYRMSDETSAALIEKLTDALCEATHPGLKDHTWVIVEGHNPKNWGLGGKPWPVGEMPPGPAS
jgi:phenylpyruvate tautomerase PptA (4-oxalocrotonate tautomerase family)